MKFKVVIEKLKKGWQLVLPVASEREGRALIVELTDRIKRVETNAERIAKFKGILKKNGKAATVSLYRSKLKHIQELVKEMFLRTRDAQEAG